MFEEIIPTNQMIDYISIDIEGNEMDVLSSIDFNKYKIKVILLENNIPQELNYLKFLINKTF